jgi:hypothetical protein
MEGMDNMKKIFVLLALLALTGLSSAMHPQEWGSHFSSPYPPGYSVGPAYNYYATPTQNPSVFYYPIYYPNGSFYAPAAYDYQTHIWQYGNGQQTWGSGYSRYNPYEHA